MGLSKRRLPEIIMVDAYDGLDMFADNFSPSNEENKVLNLLK